MRGTTIKIDGRFAKQIRGVFGQYEFEVGILQDKSHKLPGDGIRKLAGGQARRASRKSDGNTVAGVSAELRSKMRVNYLVAPFKKRSSDIIRFSREFMKLALGRSQQKRTENLLQAVVRNPLARGDYGPNSQATKSIKGFDRYGIDTGQLFNAIKARTKKRRAFTARLLSRTR